MASRHEHETKQKQGPILKPALDKPQADQEIVPVSSPEVQQALASPFTTQPAALLHLQRSAGNRATSALIQTKLMVGPAVDAYELEADRVADQVLSMPTPGPAETPAEGQPGPAETIRRVEDTPVPDQPGGLNGFEVSSDLESRLSVQKGGGSTLPGDVRTDLENRFGSDFSQVRIHTGAEAAQMSRDLSAQAFTHGHDIFFGPGKYDPGSGEGKRLLAHELTHVVQQTGAIQSKREPAFAPAPEGRIQRALDPEQIRPYVNLIKEKMFDELTQKLDNMHKTLEESLKKADLETLSKQTGVTGGSQMGAQEFVTALGKMFEAQSKGDFKEALRSLEYAQREAVALANALKGGSYQPTAQAGQGSKSTKIL